MPTLGTERPYRPVPIDAPTKRWTRAECAEMQATGVWDRQKLELIDGSLITKMPKNWPHVFVVTRVLAWLSQMFGVDYAVPESPIDVAPADNPTSEPEPDIVVLAKPMGEFLERRPQPRDLRLVVVVSGSTLGFDLTTKASLYARAAIGEYWVVDIAARRLVVHRDPQAGAYQSVAVYAEHESVAPLAAPASELQLITALPPA